MTSLIGKMLPPPVRPLPGGGLQLSQGGGHNDGRGESVVLTQLARRRQRAQPGVPHTVRRHGSTANATLE
jgi:hypothetical protein